jgi:hypothetical protein
MTETGIKCSACKQVLVFKCEELTWYGSSHKHVSLKCGCDTWNYRGPSADNHVQLIAEFYVSRVA